MSDTQYPSQLNHHTTERIVAKGEWTTLTPAERKRTYVYADERKEYNNVTRVKVSESGTHYIETGDGVKDIIAPGWRRIELDMDAWTF